jgi:hypothetical protein
LTGSIPDVGSATSGARAVDVEGGGIGGEDGAGEFPDLLAADEVRLGRWVDTTLDLWIHCHQVSLETFRLRGRAKRSMIRHECVAHDREHDEAPAVRCRRGLRGIDWSTA